MEKIKEFHCLKEALTFIKSEEIASGVRYASYKSTRNFGSIDIKEAKKVYFCDKASVKRGRLENNGIPFVPLGLKRYDCQFGKNRKKNKKQKECEDDHHRYRKGKKFLVTTSKKLGCPASCLIREICRFPTYKTTEEQTITENAFVCEDLLSRIWEGEAIPFERVFIVCLPGQSDHEGHRFGDLMPEPIDRTLSESIKKLVSDGINTPGLIRNHLNQYIKDNIIPMPHPCNRRFYPSLKRIRNITYNASTEKLVDDQRNLRDWIDNGRFREEDFVFCRLKAEQEEKISNRLHYGSKFLFAYQSKEQRYLLERYGSTIFIDATYKTTAYDLSLFFLVVRTNVDYQVVGAFVIEDEQSDSITDALTIMKDYCFTRVPSFFMTDFNEAEINALERVFPETRVVLCNFHRNQAWERWTSKKENSLNDKTEIMKWLHRLANSLNEEEFSTAYQQMSQSVAWKINTRWQQYFSKIWFPNRKIQEQITNKLTEEFIYYIQDSKNPVTGLKISLIKQLPMDTSLYRILSKGKMLAHHYLLHVMVKEVMAFLISSRYSISRDKAEEICKATEIQKQK